MEYWLDPSLFHNIAHRGASAYAPGNSLEAFKLARRQSATDVEVDLQSTRDGRFVVRHNSAIGDGQSAKFISELSFDGYRRICQQQSEPSLVLDQVIQVARENDLGIYLDVKQVLPDALAGLIELIRASGYRQKIVVASFRTDIVRQVKEIAPDLLTSVMFHDPNLDSNSLVKAVVCDFLHPCFDIFDDPLKYFTSQLVDRLRTTGAGLIGWNITTAEMADAVVVLDINGACADDPQILKHALARHRS